MRKIVCLVFLFSVICGNVSAQNGRKLSESETRALERKLIEHSASIRTLQCAFVQEKTSSLISEKAVARGTMLYQAPSMLRWEYATPTPSTLILNGTNAILLDKDGKRMGNERMLRQLGGIIISMINGSGIAQNRQFSSVFYELNQAQILVVLTPVQKRMRDIYSKIELKIDQKTMLASDIILYENNGDKTTISLTNKTLNVDISRDKFSF